MSRIDPEPTPRHLPAPAHPPANGAGAEPEHVRTLRDYLGLARRHWVMVAVGALLGLGGAGWFVLQDREEFRARAVVRMVEDEPQLPRGMQAVGGQAIGGTDRILSQIQILRSRTVLGEVVDSVGLQLVALTEGFPRALVRAENLAPEASGTLHLRFDEGGYQVAGGRSRSLTPYGRPLTLAAGEIVVERRPEVEEASLELRPRRRAIQELEEELRARPRELTNVVDIDFVAHDPWVAESVVNQTALVFQALSRHRAQQEARRRRAFIEEQLTQTDSLLADAQRRFSGFRRREQLHSSSEAFATRQSGLMELDIRREELLADQRMLAGLLGSLRQAEGEARMRGLRSLMGMPDLAANAAVNALITQLLEYEAVRDSLTTGDWARASSHPDVRRVETLVRETRDRLLDAVDSHLDVLGARIEAIDGLRTRYAAQMDELPQVEAEEARLAQEVQTLAGVADLLREELQSARIAEAVEGGEVEIVDLAAGASPLPGGRTRNLLLGLLVGLLAGGGAALVADSLNSSIRGKGELEHLLRVPALAVIPRIGTGKRSGSFRLPVRSGNGGGNGRPATPPRTSRELVTINDNRSSSAEAYRTLRTNLIFSRSIQTLRRIVVTSPGPAEGKTTTVANLGVTFAHQGMRVLLVDCDLRRARLHDMFDVPREPGLTQWVLGYASPEEAVRETDVPGLHVLPAGFLPPNPSELLGGEEMARAMERLSEDYDLVIVDSPPLQAASDAAILATRAQGVLLVIQAGATERSAAVGAVHQIQAVGAHTLGTVLNDPEGKLPAYGGYDYYGYRYYGSEE